ncbi:MAG: hypothetical protein CL424_03695 [Acidimicrobiaceae bacterium]|nr:hypothetical protein [Acidimicrobiaceae bacterium]
MIFGESFSAPASTEPAEWISDSVGGGPWTVGTLVPSGYESVVRLHAPDPTPDGWWELYRDLFVHVASLGALYTTTPTRGWFAIWEGHGFDKTTRRIAWPDRPTDDAERQRRAAQRERLRIADRERNAKIGSALAVIPRFALPGRVYYLTQGPLSAMADLRYPGLDGWRNPDLFWPHDRSWFAATDVDFWSLFVGGPGAFTSELTTRASTRCSPVHYHDRLPSED